MRILVNCYACSPYKGSEPGMGWNFVKGLSKYHELNPAKRNVLDLKNETCKNREKRNVLKKIAHTTL